MNSRKLQIFVSAVCLSAGALMVIVWVQSYGQLNAIGPKQVAAASKLYASKLLVGVVIALYIVGCVVVAFVPVRWWITRQFSLRAMLMVTTLMAIALGLAVYVARK